MAANNATRTEPEAVDDDTSGLPISVADSADTGEGGKLKMIVQLLKKCLGVKDIASMRLSLPASLLEPIPNLEYWHYLDRPDYFAAINDSDDPFERMLAVLRFSFTKDLRHVHGGVCKPYNSVLGEHFRAHWNFTPLPDPSQSPTPSARLPSSTTEITVSDTVSVKSSKSSKSNRSGFSAFSRFGKSPSTAATTPAAASPQPGPTADNLPAQISILNLDEGDRLRVAYLTEQVSHHPPVSAFYVSCPSRSIEMQGIDQIVAKVSGTSVRVSSGEYNKGLFINITGGLGEGEQYHLTYPVASVNGILMGSFYVTISDSTIITCTGGKHGSKFRTIIEYKEGSWLGRSHFLVDGVIHSVHEGETQHEEWTKVKHVPQSHVVAVFDGSWRGVIRWRRVGLGSYPHASSVAPSPTTSQSDLTSALHSKKSASKADLVTHDEEYTTLIDLSALEVISKTVRPLEQQLPNESRKMWFSVTENLLKKEFSEATRYKVAIEQKQRDDAAERKRKGVEFVPRYFDKDMSKGWSELTVEGRGAIDDELSEDSVSAATEEGSKAAKPASP